MFSTLMRIPCLRAGTHRQARMIGLPPIYTTKKFFLPGGTFSGAAFGVACCKTLPLSTSCACRVWYNSTRGDKMRFRRITVDPQVCTGKPCIRGLRFPVSRLLGLLASGETKEDILKAYPYLEAEDVEEALLFAAYLADDETVEFAQ